MSVLPCNDDSKKNCDSHGIDMPTGQKSNTLNL